MRKLMLLAAAVLAFVIVPAWGEGVEYVVQKGDTLWSIAKKFGVPVELLMSFNGITDPATVKVGTVLKIPGSYVVKKGDTFYSIAKRFGITVDSLLAMNGLKSGAVLKEGQKLLVPLAPGGSGATATATSSAGSATGASALSSSPSASTGGSASSAGSKGSTAAVKAVSWPCEGERKPVTGKLEGVVILAKEKAPVRFVASGTVIGVSPFQGYGMVVFVQAKSGYLYVYGGMELVSVKNGDKVVSGMNAGVVGIDMKIRVPAAYFFVTYKGKSVDPATAPRE